LILFSTIVDYSVGLGLLKQENPTKRKILLWTSNLGNLGFLGFFKYYNFFLYNFITAFSFLGVSHILCKQQFSTIANHPVFSMIIAK